MIVFKKGSFQQKSLRFRLNILIITQIPAALNYKIILEYGNKVNKSYKLQSVSKKINITASIIAIIEKQLTESTTQQLRMTTINDTNTFEPETNDQFESDGDNNQTNNDNNKNSAATSKLKDSILDSAIFGDDVSTSGGSGSIEQIDQHYIFLVLNLS
eukprot:447610_1